MASLSEPLNPRGQIGGVVRRLRQERSWTQAELARELGLSQSRLSEIEHGGGSFTAEQFLCILRLFNVGLSRFAGTGDDRELQLQNAIARLGAHHLQESSRVLPADDLDDVAAVISETLVQGNPRLTTALAPVLVSNIDRIALGKLYLDLDRIGRERRLGWLSENTLDAIWRSLTHGGTSRVWNQRARRTAAVLGAFLESLTRDRANANGSWPALDILDLNLRSKQSIESARVTSSEISRKWGIVTGIQPKDFAEALQSAHVADR
jgi:transcriptional regulator with XRE-family HTH domain